MFDPFDTDQFVGNLFYEQNGATNDKDFETVVGIEVNMHGRNDLVVMCMLVVSQLIGKIPHMMVIHQCHCADRLLILGSAPFFDK